MTRPESPGDKKAFYLFVLIFAIAIAVLVWYVAIVPKTIAPTPDQVDVSPTPSDDTPANTRTVPFEDVERGFNSGFEVARTYVIENEVDWEALWETTYAHSDAVPELPEVDFGEQMVLAVFQGQQPTGGYAIEVRGVSESDTELVVRVREVEPTDDALVTQALTSPFHIVTIPLSEKPVRFAF